MKPAVLIRNKYWDLREHTADDSVVSVRGLFTSMAPGLLRGGSSVVSPCPRQVGPVLETRDGRAVRHGLEALPGRTSSQTDVLLSQVEDNLPI